MTLLAALVVLVAFGLSFGLRLDHAATPVVLLAIGVPYALLGGVAIARMWRDGVLGEKLRPRSGDLALGAFVGMLLYFATLAARMAIAPHGSTREQWLMRIYLQLGDPETIQRRLLPITLAVVAIAALEEIAWRGLGFALVEEKLGTRRAYPATAALYGLAHVPTLYVLAVPAAGYNPLVLFAALAGGLVWGFIVARTGRLPVAIFSHVVWTWLVAIQFPLWRLG